MPNYRTGLLRVAMNSRNAYYLATIRLFAGNGVEAVGTIVCCETWPERARIGNRRCGGKCYSLN
jgi:hypothetical protein